MQVPRLSIRITLDAKPVSVKLLGNLTRQSNENTERKLDIDPSTNSKGNQLSKTTPKCLDAFYCVSTQMSDQSVLRVEAKFERIEITEEILAQDSTLLEALHLAKAGQSSAKLVSGTVMM